MMDALVVLVHSPLVGPLTWTPVAEELGRLGAEVLVPPLTNREGDEQPFWRQHAEAVARALAPVPDRRPLVLVGHSGAGPLLPAIAQAAWHPVAAYLFVDAGLPEAGQSRLDLMAPEDPEFAGQLREHLAIGGRFPTWSEDDLREVIPDARLRRGVVAEMCPRSQAFFAEPIPVFSGWPDAPCGYLRLSPAYAVPAQRAIAAGWVYRAIEAGHFHLLVDPTGVAQTLVDMMNDCGGGRDGRWGRST